MCPRNWRLNDRFVQSLSVIFVAPLPWNPRTASVVVVVWGATVNLELDSGAGKLGEVEHVDPTKTATLVINPDAAQLQAAEAPLAHGDRQVESPRQTAP